MIPRIGSALVASSPFPPPALQSACQQATGLRLRALHAVPIRHASSSTASLSAPAYAHRRREGRVNPPASTLPAPVHVPRRQPDQSLLNYALNSGKAYLQFYKTGVKSVWNNRKEAKAIKNRVRQSPAVRPTSDLDASHVPYTRGQFQLLRRSSYDMRRVPVFAVLFLLIGEWLPLVAAYFTSLVPIPCRIPAQTDKEEASREEQRRRARELVLKQAQEHGVPVLPGDGAPTVNTLKRLHTERIQLERVAAHVHDPVMRKKALALYLRFAVSSFNVRSLTWDKLPAGGFPSTPWVLKLRRHLAYLAIDDALLARDGGVDALRPAELRVACSERGMDISDRKDDVLRKDLRAWVQNKKAAAWMNALYSPSKDKKLVG